MCKLLHNTNMMSFIGYINNAVIKLLINFNLNMCMYVISCIYIGPLGIQTIKMFTLFLYILIFLRKISKDNHISTLTLASKESW